LNQRRKGVSRVASYSTIRNTMTLRIEDNGRLRSRSYRIKENATADEVWSLANTFAGLMANTVSEVRETDYHQVNG